jgi:PAS domain S-box-containing protein
VIASEQPPASGEHPIEQASVEAEAARRARRHVATAIVLTLVFAAVMGRDVLSRDVEAALSVIVQAVGAWIACGATIAASLRATGRWRLAWQLLAVATGLWLAGNVATIVVGLLSDGVFPSVADVFLTAALPVAAAGLLSIPGRLDWQGRARLGIDGLLIAGALLYIIWVTLIGRAIRDLDVGDGTKAVVLAYFLLDTLVYAVSFALVLRSRPGARRPLLLLCSGFIAYAITDGLFLRRSLGGTFELGAATDAGWLLGLLLIAAAGVSFTAADDASADAPRRRASRQRVLVGSLVTLLPFFAVFVVDATTPALDPTSRLGAGILLIVTSCLFVHAQFLTLRENLRLEGGLHATVVQRTDELEDTLEFNDMTLRTVGDGILGLGHDGRLVLVNDAACTMLKLPRDQILGRFVYEVVTVGPPDHSLLLTMQQSVAEGRTFELDDVEVQLLDGTCLSVELSVNPASQDHPLLTSVAVFHDVTRRHEVDRMKDEFVSVVSHELRTPLTSIRGSLGLLAGGAVGEIPPQGQRMVEIAVESTDRLIRLINDILDIERIRSGAIVLDRRRCEAVELVTASLGVVTPLARDAGVELAVGHVEGAAWGDPDRLVQTLTNLVSNAVKFSPRDSVITVSAEPRGAQMLFRVADQGRGIPADQLEAVFGRFQQVDASDARRSGGSGLGLAISRSIVEQHGGRIWVESTVGEGSTFSFTVPIARADPQGVAPVDRG